MSSTETPTRSRRVSSKSGVAVRQHRWYVPLVFIGPVLIIQGTFLFAPMINTFILSFTNVSTMGGGQFIGLDNFVRMAGDPAFLAAVGRSLLYVGIIVPTITALAVGLALLLNTLMRGTNTVRTIAFSPMVMPMAIVAILFEWLLRSDGMVNQMLAAVNLINEPIRFLSDPSIAIFSVMMVTLWKGVALYTLILLAALQNVSQELEEAAELDGAGWFRRTLSVTLPQVRGTTLLVAILAAITSIRVFTEPYVMTGGGPGRSTETVVLYLFRQGISPGTDAGYASAISLFIFALVIVVSLLRWLASRRVQG